MIKGKKIFILGMARSGYEAARLLATNNKVVITDMKDQNKEQLHNLKRLGVKFIKCDDPTEFLDETFDLMVKNPGIKYTHNTVVKAKNLGIPVINEVEAAFSYIPKGVHIIGVTGSNGKTTTVTLIYNFLKNAGKNVYLGGNIGYPLSSIVKKLKKKDYLVIEISDHQLCDMYDFKTEVSVLNNIFEAHTDFHDTHERYKQMKKRIFNNHTKKDYAIINYDNEESLEDFILPGQKFSTPPAGDATRAFYESLLEQRPDSMMAKKYCVEYGCLEPDKANEYIAEMEKKKKKK